MTVQRYTQTLGRQRGGVRFHRVRALQKQLPSPLLAAQTGQGEQGQGDLSGVLQSPEHEPARVCTEERNQRAAVSISKGDLARFGED